MCVIAYKPVGVANFSRETLQKCWDTNDDGAGFAWWNAEERAWNVHKGFMSWKKFWKGYKVHDFQPNDCVIVHFRIGTAGLKDGGNTHPFPVTDNMEIMRQTEYSSQSVLFHNGVVGKGEGDYSDTMVFVRDYISPLIDLLGTDDRIPKILEKICEGASRFLVTKGDKLWRFGYTWVEREGCFFSNANWEYRACTTPSPYVNGSATSYGNGAGFTGNYGAGANRWRHHRGYANEFGRYENGKWTRWDEDDEILDLAAAPAANGVVDFTQAKASKKTNRETKDKEDHSRTKTLFAVVGDDGEVKFSDRARTYIEKRGLTYIVCPECYEDKYIDEAPDYCIGSGGDTLCRNCGAIFHDVTGETVMFDLATYRKARKDYDSIVQKPANWSKLTPAEKQVIIDAESDELIKTGYY